MRLQGQTAVVTGGGRGIGRAIALALAQEGARVVVNARTPAEVEAVVREIDGMGQQAVGVLADVTVAAEVDRLMAESREQLGDIDILINNAGGVPSELYAESGALLLDWQVVWDEPEASWERMLASNLTSVFLCAKAVIPRMIERGHGEIVTIASQTARVVGRSGGSYAVAKTAALKLTELLAVQAGKHGIRVNAVSPGAVETVGNTRLLRARAPGRELPVREPAETVARAVLYVLCDAPRSMNGQSLDTFGIG